MGTILIFLLCVAITVTDDVLAERNIISNKELPQWWNVIASVSHIAIICISIFMALRATGLRCLDETKYNKEMLVENIPIEKFDDGNYIYYHKVYRYIKKDEVSSDEISKHSNVVEEVVDNKEKPRIEHYQLSEPNNFLDRYLPWTVDKYVIYVPDKNLIIRSE